MRLFLPLLVFFRRVIDAMQEPIYLKAMHIRFLSQPGVPIPLSTKMPTIAYGLPHQMLLSLVILHVTGYDIPDVDFG